MTNTQRVQEQIDILLSISPDAIIRVYPNALPHVTHLGYCIMKEDATAQQGRGHDNGNVLAFVATEKADVNSWVSESEDVRFGGDGTEKIIADAEGCEYVERRNGDFGTPYTPESDAVQAMIEQLRSVLANGIKKYTITNDRYSSQPDVVTLAELVEMCEDSAFDAAFTERNGKIYDKLGEVVAEQLKD